MLLRLLKFLGFNVTPNDTFLKKYGLKPKKVQIEYNGKNELFHYRPISYNLAVAITGQTNDLVRQLLIIRHCLCDKNGKLIFDEKKDLAEIGDELSFDLVGLMSKEIANASGPQAQGKDILKKPVS